MSQRIWRINPGSKAVLANLCPGDVIQAINGEDVDSMTHLEAQNKIKACLDQLMLSVNRIPPETDHFQIHWTHPGVQHPSLADDISD
ncbi:PDZ and LIM domain protein 4-like isoform X2 [Petaurus breviceps papuanus]|uniref:PDZ and LIM domain protein 4-like isoform X2 n=1 Tax=Petaurus breviceps papuanus TaxID=3040969 RepID=UPI0036DE42BE